MRLVPNEHGVQSFDLFKRGLRHHETWHNVAVAKMPLNLVFGKHELPKSERCRIHSVEPREVVMVEGVPILAIHIVFHLTNKGARSRAGRLPKHEI